MKRNLVLILGAGATYSEVSNKSDVTAPPLDKLFFHLCKSKYPDLVTEIREYFLKYYHKDILKQKYDSLESVMASIYTDIYDIRLKDNATKVFVALIKLFNKRLASSTNSIKINHQRQLYRLVANYFESGYEPDRITFITFNQDLHIEKVLDHLQSKEKWKSLEFFSFPKCYNLDMTGLRTTTPKNKQDFFEQRDDIKAKISVLKLHGSLNWYSPNDSNEYSPELFFMQSRELIITTRKQIYLELRYNNPDSLYTLPIIVPPVSHKSAVLHDQLKIVWQKAEHKLRTADEIVFWGYSLPDLDFESRNLFQRIINKNPNSYNISLIDPSSEVAKKYIDILEIKNLHYYENIHYFLEKYFIK